MPHSFPCDAEKLLELVADFYFRNKWFNPDKMAKAHAVFLKLVDRIYRGELLELATCALPNQYTWARIAKIVLFGKDNRIPQNDWIRALGIQVTKNNPKP